MSEMTGKGIAAFTAAVVVVAAGVVGIVIATSGNKPALTSSAKLPVCPSSKITVSLGANVQLSSAYANATQLIPVLFKNHGKACDFREGGPSVIAGTRSRDAPARLSHSSMGTITPRPFKLVGIARGAKDEALFEVLKVPASGGESGNGCVPKTATWLAISGYALPVDSVRYFTRQSFKVCFTAPGGPQVLDTALTWVSARQYLRSVIRPSRSLEVPARTVRSKRQHGV